MLFEVKSISQMGFRIFRRLFLFFEMKTLVEGVIFE